jgi:hypothetical protein
MSMPTRVDNMYARQSLFTEDAILDAKRRAAQRNALPIHVNDTHIGALHAHSRAGTRSCTQTQLAN